MMKTKIKKSDWIVVCIGMALMLVPLSYFISTIFQLYSIFNKKVEPASVKGALAYLESEYGRDDYEVKFLKENFVEPHKESAGGIDGTYFSKDAPARTETCYLCHSPQNDLYFYVFHSSDKKAENTYRATLREELAIIKKFEEVKIYAKEVFGDRFKGTDVHLYTWENRPLYNYGNFKPIYDKADIDARNVYNHFFMDTEDPFLSGVLHSRREEINFALFPCLNIYVDCSLEELKVKMKEEKSNFLNISTDLVFIVNDGVYH